MIDAIIGWCIANRTLVFLAALGLVGWGWVALGRVPLDAIPDLSAHQVVVMTEYAGRGPQIVEDQVTYPVSSALRGLPGLVTVRGQSMFGLSMVFALFDDDVDLYWARTRVTERLQTLGSGALPPGVQPMLGPDGTGVGHVFWYHLQGSGQDLATLRAVQDWYLKPALSAVGGVAEVASVGGFVRQYQVHLDPHKLAAAGVTPQQVTAAVRSANGDVGGRLLEVGEREITVRGLGLLTSVDDLARTAVTTRDGVPIRLDQLGTVALGPAPRRGLLEFDGTGEVAGGIIVMRVGENARATIGRVKTELERLAPGLPAGVTVVTDYDRSGLIDRAVATLRLSLIEEMVLVALIVLLFLWHARSALVIIVSLPVAVLIAFILMERIGLTSNLMSLGGIAVAIGAMVDAAIVMVENGHRRLSEAQASGQPVDRIAVLTASARQVGRPIFFSLVVMVLSFLPVFLLTGEEGKLFGPLAWTKTFALIGSTVLAITLVPALMALLMRGRMRPERDNPISRFATRLYTPALNACLRHPWTTLAVNLVALLIAVPMLVGLHIGPLRIAGIGSEFMPPLDEGDLLFMPVTLPGVSLSEARRIVGLQDSLLRTVPEVAHALGKVGRAETATDAAPISMIETIVTLKPRTAWRAGLTRAALIAELDERLRIPGVTNGWTQPIINRINMLNTGVRTDVGLKLYGDRLDTLDALARRAQRLLSRIPGAVDLYADRALGGQYLDIRVDRDRAARYGLSVGAVEETIETAVGGQTVTQVLDGRARYPVEVRYRSAERDGIAALEQLPVPIPVGATRPLLAPPMPGGGGAMTDATGTLGGLSGPNIPLPDAPRRYSPGGPDPAAGLGAMSGPMAGVDGMSSSAMDAGGMNLGGMPSGGMSGGMGGGSMGGGSGMSSPGAMGSSGMPSPSDEWVGGAFVPLGQVATLTMAPGPSMIASENGQLQTVVMLNVRGRDLGGFMAEAEQTVSAGLNLPPGYRIGWSGSWENQLRAKARLRLIVPLVLATILVLLYLTFRSWTEAALVMLSVPFALVGGVYLLWLLGLNASVAVWVGFIALYGVAVETGVVMVVYLHEALDERRTSGTLRTEADLLDATRAGAVLRLRPKLMTVATTLLGLTPLLWATGTGADVMAPIAVPMVGGMVTSAIHVLLVTPVIFILIKRRALVRGTLHPDSTR